MEPDQAPSPVPSYAAGILRNAISGLVAYAAGKGWLPADQAPEVVAGAVVLVSAIWSIIQKRNAHVDLKAAIAAPTGQAK